MNQDLHITFSRLFFFQDHFTHFQNLCVFVYCKHSLGFLADVGTESIHLASVVSDCPHYMYRVYVYIIVICMQTRYPSLKKLAKEILGLDIQSKEHSPVSVDCTE